MHHRVNGGILLLFILLFSSLFFFYHHLHHYLPSRGSNSENPVRFEIPAGGETKAAKKFFTLCDTRTREYRQHEKPQIPRRKPPLERIGVKLKGCSTSHSKKKKKKFTFYNRNTMKKPLWKGRMFDAFISKNG